MPVIAAVETVPGGARTESAAPRPVGSLTSSPGRVGHGQRGSQPGRIGDRRGGPDRRGAAGIGRNRDLTGGHFCGGERSDGCRDEADSATGLTTGRATALTARTGVGLMAVLTAGLVALTVCNGDGHWRASWLGGSRDPSGVTGRTMQEAAVSSVSFRFHAL
jgi:hypothetical protein